MIQGGPGQKFPTSWARFSGGRSLYGIPRNSLNEQNGVRPFQYQYHHDNSFSFFAKEKELPRLADGYRVGVWCSNAIRQSNSCPCLVVVALYQGLVQSSKRTGERERDEMPLCVRIYPQTFLPPSFGRGFSAEALEDERGRGALLIHTHGGV